MPTISVVITGRVQGVGFRSFVERVADSLEICGEVWNTRGGAVEAIAQHDDQTVLDTFIEKLKFGPGRVDRVISCGFQSKESYTQFEVTYSR